ncbi:MAG: hypothetical protein ABI364_08820, partial [Caldimonas sp.]
MNMPAWRSVLPGAVEMKANTAACLILAGVALILCAGRSPPRLRQFAQLLGGVVALVGLATGMEYALGWNLHIDEMLFVDTGNAYNVIAGHMSPYSTVGFVGIGVSLVALTNAKWRPVVWLLASLFAGIGLVSMLGYVWNASELVTDNVLPPVAINTGLAFTLLSVGALRVSQPRFAKTAGNSLPHMAPIEFKVAAGLLGAFILLIAAGVRCRVCRPAGCPKRSSETSAATCAPATRWRNPGAGRSSAIRT